MDHSYAQICNHRRLRRINANFVRCLDCGQSMVSQRDMAINKTQRDFARENESFDRNFNRNFSNEIEETDNEKMRALLEYYTDRNWANIIVVDRSPAFYSHPVKHKTIINGKEEFLTGPQVSKILADISAIRIDEQQIKQLCQKQPSATNQRLAHAKKTYNRRYVPRP